MRKASRIYKRKSRSNLETFIILIGAIIILGVAFNLARDRSYIPPEEPTIIEEEKVESLVIKTPVELPQKETAEKVEEITTAIIGIISEKKVELEKGCFLYFSLESIGDIAPSKITSGLRRDVWSRLLEYHGMYELIDKETYGPEGFIKEIHAHIDDVFDEKMIIKEVDR